MRKKALIVGGLSSFEGPWINLEEGNWLVEPPLNGVVRVIVDHETGAKFFSWDLSNGEMLIEGPAKVRAIVVDCDCEAGIHLDVKLIKRAIAAHR